jgi:hypothetical protein
MEEEARWLQVRMNVYKVIIVSHFESTKPVAASIWGWKQSAPKRVPFLRLYRSFHDKTVQN